MSLQANRKTKEGSQHPDRDAQFRYINDKVTAAVKENRPAISIDTKKKELVGEYRNGNRPEPLPDRALIDHHTRDLTPRASIPHISRHEPIS